MQPIEPAPTSAPQAIVKLGGLSGGAHAAHVIACIFTCGLWIPGYVLTVILAPKKRVEVIAPIGTDPAAIDEVRAQALALTPAERSTRRTNLIAFAVVAGVLLVLCLGGWLIGQLT